MDLITSIILAASFAVTIGGPVAFAIIGLKRSGPTPARRSTQPASAGMKAFIASLLLSTLAFNLMFFVQELFLVLPKAVTPGLYPTLYHNNHDWTGENPLAELLQGTGALAVALLSAALLALLKLAPPRNLLLRMFLVWLVFHGFFQSLPQIVVGAVLPGNDVGRAMTYLGLPQPAKMAAAFAAMGVIVYLALLLRRPFLELAQSPDDIATPRARMTFVLRTATLPLAASLLLIFMFRVPGSIDQVYIVPVAVAIIGIGWIQGGAWAETRAVVRESKPIRALIWPGIALMVMFSFFHLMLAPGVNFF